MYLRERLRLFHGWVFRHLRKATYQLHCILQIIDTHVYRIMESLSKCSCQSLQISKTGNLPVSSPSEIETQKSGLNA